MNRAHQGAYNKGAQAAMDGKSIDSCPYNDVRNGMNRVTFSRAFRKEWLKGYRSVPAVADRVEGQSICMVCKFQPEECVCK